MNNFISCMPTYVYSVWNDKKEKWQSSPLLCAFDEISKSSGDYPEQEVHKCHIYFISITSGYVNYCVEETYKRDFDSRASVLFKNVARPDSLLGSPIPWEDCRWICVGPLWHFNWDLFNCGKIYDVVSRQWITVLSDQKLI